MRHAMSVSTDQARTSPPDFGVRGIGRRLTLGHRPRRYEPRPGQVGHRGRPDTVCVEPARLEPPPPTWLRQAPTTTRRYQLIPEWTVTVPLDWNRAGTSNREPLLRPRDIFAALASRTWPYLRQAQAEVLGQTISRRDDHAVATEQNT